MNKNVASQKVTLLVIDTANNVPKTGDAANLTAYVSKDDGSVTVLGDTSATELDATNAPGLYSFDLTQAETNADKLVFSGKSSTADMRVVPLLVYTRPPNFSTLTIANNAVDADLERIAGAVVSAASAQLGVNVVQAGGTAWGSGAITAASIAAAAFTKAKFHADTGLIPLLTGTAGAGSGTTITLTGGVASNDYYNGALVYILSGTGAGQARFITDYVGGTTVAAVDAWITNPDNTSVFAVLPGFAVTVSDIQSGLATATELAKVPKSDSNVTWNATAAAQLQQEATDALNAYDPPTRAEATSDKDEILADTDALALAIDAVLAHLEDAVAEKGQGAPAANAPLVDAVRYLYQWARNKRENDGTQNLFYGDDGTTVKQKQTTAESGGTVAVGEMATGA